MWDNVGDQTRERIKRDLLCIVVNEPMEHITKKVGVPILVCGSGIEFFSVVVNASRWSTLPKREGWPTAMLSNPLSQHAK